MINFKNEFFILIRSLGCILFEMINFESSLDFTNLKDTIESDVIFENLKTLNIFKRLLKKYLI